MVPASKAPKVTILIPIYNEEYSIAQVVWDVNKTMESTRYSFEILVVDDCSSDRTVLRIPSLWNLRLVRRLYRGGSGACRRTGIEDARGEIIVMIDGDDSYNAEDIPNLLRLFPEYDQVNGKRIRETGRFTWLRIPVKAVINKIACILTRENIPDLNTGMKAFKRDLMLKYIDLIPDRFSCVSTMTLVFLKNGHNVTYIPVKYFERRGQSKFHPIKDTFRYLKTVLKICIFFRRQYERSRPTENDSR